RLAAGLGSFWAARRRLRALRVEPALPGWLELRERLMPRHQTLGIDAPAPGPASRMHWSAPASASLDGALAILGFELGSQADWPPEPLPAGVRNLGLCDSRDDRRRILDRLQRPPRRLLLVCDARQTPDRGTRAWLAELQSACPRLDVLLMHRPGREALWHGVLETQGIPITSSIGQWADADHD